MGTGDTAALDAAAPVLGRGLSSRHVAMISIGGIIGAGLFVGSSAAIATVGPAILLSYLLAGGGRAGRHADARRDGDGHAGTRRIHGVHPARLGSWAGFVSGWLYWYFWVVVVAIEAIAGAALLHAWIALPVWAIVLVLMLALTAVNLMSSRSYGEFEFWFASIKVGAIIAFILIAGAYALGLTSPAGPTFTNLYSDGGFAPFGWAAALAGATTIVFSLCGAEIATVAAAESNEEAGAISKLTGTLALRILLFYVLSILLIVSGRAVARRRAGQLAVRARPRAHRACRAPPRS